MVSNKYDEVRVRINRNEMAIKDLAKQFKKIENAWVKKIIKLKNNVN